jgi:hypothetical protein
VATVSVMRADFAEHCGKSFSGDAGYCRHFVGSSPEAEIGQCAKVEGTINRIYWCKLFARADSK